MEFVRSLFFDKGETDKVNYKFTGSTFLVLSTSRVVYTGLSIHQGLLYIQGLFIHTKVVYTYKGCLYIQIHSSCTPKVIHKPGKDFFSIYPKCTDML